MGKKKEHQWDFMGNDHTDDLGDWAYCSLCKKWKRTYSDKVFKMSFEDYQKMVESGKITGV